MAINIVVSDLVRFKVAGAINDEHGSPIPFDFWLVMERLKDSAAVQAYWRDVQESSSPTALIDALQARARGWTGVNGPGGAVEFSGDSFRSLVSLPGMASMVNMAYLRESGAKEKN